MSVTELPPLANSLTACDYLYAVRHRTGASRIERQEKNMRTQFIQAETLAEAQDSAPWAAEIIEVEGGFMAFQSSDDAATWRAQA